MFVLRCFRTLCRRRVADYILQCTVFIIMDPAFGVPLRLMALSGSPCLHMSVFEALQSVHDCTFSDSCVKMTSQFNADLFIYVVELRPTVWDSRCILIVTVSFGFFACHSKSFSCRDASNVSVFALNVIFKK